MTDELKKIWKEAIFNLIEELLQNMPVRAEETH
jgi:hypothetical protein